MTSLYTFMHIRNMLYKDNRNDSEDKHLNDLNAAWAETEKVKEELNKALQENSNLKSKIREFHNALYQLRFDGVWDNDSVLHNLIDSIWNHYKEFFK